MNKKGFTLLIGLLVAGILLVIGLSIFSLSEKQLELTTATRDSERALYNADTGLECALYWDLKSQDQPVSCNGQQVSNGSFSISFNNGVDGCVIVSVTNNGSGTTTLSNGYNSCNSNPAISTGPSQVERTLQISY